MTTTRNCLVKCSCNTTARISNWELSAFHSGFPTFAGLKKCIMQLIEVKDSQDAAAFIRVNVEINKNDPNYIQPLEKDIKEVFDPKKNKTFRHGEVIRWILKDSNGKLIGRIAAFINKKYKNKGDEFPVGGIGFFESI